LENFSGLASRSRHFLCALVFGSSVGVYEPINFFGLPTLNLFDMKKSASDSVNPQEGRKISGSHWAAVRKYIGVCRKTKFGLCLKKPSNTMSDIEDLQKQINELKRDIKANTGGIDS
jgi:hypothetical protein